MLFIFMMLNSDLCSDLNCEILEYLWHMG